MDKLAEKRSATVRSKKNDGETILERMKFS